MIKTCACRGDAASHDDARTDLADPGRPGPADAPPVRPRLLQRRVGLGPPFPVVLRPARLRGPCPEPPRARGERGRGRLPFHSLRDYVADVEQVTGLLPRAPVLIGHSLGGMVVQKILRSRPVPAAVLMAPVPPHGLLASAVGMALTKPELYAGLAWAGTTGPGGVPSDALRKALFSDATPDDEVVACFRRFQPESVRVVVDLMGCDLPPSRPLTTPPVLLLGAENDGFVSPAALGATGRAFGTTPEIFPGLAHAMMLDHGWEAVARRILEWLAETLDVGE